MTHEDAKLKYVMAEIKDILLEHDVAGVVILHTPGQSELLVQIDPSYSCAKFNEAGNEIRVHSKLSDFGGDKKAQNKKVADTVNMFVTMNHWLGLVALIFIKIEERLEKQFDITRIER